MDTRQRKKAHKNLQDNTRRAAPVKKQTVNEDDDEEELDAIRIDPVDQVKGDSYPEEEDDFVDDARPYRHLQRNLHEMRKRESNEANRQMPFVDEQQRVVAEATKHKSSSSCYCFIVSMFAVLAMISSFVFFDGQRFFKNTIDLSLEKNVWQNFSKEFAIFEKNYSEILPIMGTKVLRTAVRNIMDKKSIAPAVILLIASEDNENTLKCIERDFIDIINKAYDESDSLVIDGRQTNSKDIVEKVDQTLGSDRKHLIVIENIEAIDAPEVMSLHQFTDHENAKYKQVIIILTALHYQDIELTRSAKLNQMDAIATSLFQIKWKNDMAEEQRFALISRLTPSVVTIIGQKEC